MCFAIPANQCRFNVCHRHRMQFDPSFFSLEVSHAGALKLSVCNRRHETKPERHTNSVICSKVVEVSFGVIDRPVC